MLCKFADDPVLADIRDFIGLKVRGRAVLELGCGVGQWSVSFALAGAQVVWIDVAEKPLQVARRSAAS